MHNIIPFSIEYTHDLMHFAQELRNFLAKLDGRLDEPLDYNTEKEVAETLQEFETWKNMIFISIENEKAHWYILVKIRDEDWEWTALKKYGKIEELYIQPAYRGKWASKALILKAEEYLKEQWVQYMELSVMAGNMQARAFYEKMWLIEHKITLAKRLDLYDPLS